MATTGKEWTKDLQPGDQVAANFGSYGYESYKILTVRKVTPTGIIKTEDDNGQEYVFNPNGYERTAKSRGSFSRHLHIEPFTLIVYDKIQRKRMVAKLNSIDFKDLTTVKLQKLCEVLEETE